MKTLSLKELRTTLRLAEGSDFEGLCALEQGVFLDNAYDGFVLRQILTAHSDLFAVCETEDGFLAGYCVATFDAGSDSAWVLSLGVEESCRGVGVGSSLLSFIEGVLQEKGAEKISLHVSPQNSDALSLYFSAGYENEGVIEDFGKQGQRRLVMVKDLVHQ